MRLKAKLQARPSARPKRLLAGVAITGLCLTMTACRSDAPQGKVNLPEGFDLQAHRGGRDARPENTLPAFAYALSIGVTTIELDMVITADGVPVVHHSNKLMTYLARNPWGKFLTIDEQPDIRHWTLADLKKFDLGTMSPDAPHGYWEAHGRTQKAIPGTTIATLEEVLRLVRDWGNDRVFLSVEAKSTPYPVSPDNPSPKEWVEAFYRLVVKHGMQDRVMLQSFDWRVLQEMKKVDPRIATVALTANQPSWRLEGEEGDYQWRDADGTAPWMAGRNLGALDEDPVLAAAAIDADVYSAYHAEITPEVIARAHSLGLRVVPYTVNDPDEMRTLIEMGVDGLITDRPATLRGVMQALGLPVPPKDPDPTGKPYFSGTDGP